MKPHKERLSTLGLDIGLSCPRCRELLDVFLDFEDITTHDLYNHFEGRMTHSTLDKHINHLISDKLIYRMLTEELPSESKKKRAKRRTMNLLEFDVIALFHRISKRRESLEEVDSGFTKDAVTNVLNILRENLRFNCPECGFEHLVPIFTIGIAESLEDIDKSDTSRVETNISGTIAYQCPYCKKAFNHEI